MRKNLNLATFNGKDTNNAKMCVGFHLGVVAEYALKNSLSYYFLHKGQILGKRKKNTKLNYLIFPAMFKDYVMKGLSIQVDH